MISLCILCASPALILGCWISYRLIVTGQDIVKPELGNIALLFLAFLLNMSGFGLILIAITRFQW